MGKITFRADDDLVDELEAFDASKSEVMREALRSYLDREASTPSDPSDGTIDAVVRECVDDRIEERLDGRAPVDAADVHVQISIDGDGVNARTRDADGRRGGVGRGHAGRRDVERDDVGRSELDRADGGRPAADGAHARENPGGEHRLDGSSDRPLPPPGFADGDTECGQCGTSVDPEHVYCPNCGEKASKRVYCECGDEVRSDWAFCPACGRRTPAADVLDSR